MRGLAWGFGLLVIAVSGAIILALRLVPAGPPAARPEGKAAAAPPAAVPPPARYVPVGFEALRGWRDDRPWPALEAFLRSCPKLLAGGRAMARQAGGLDIRAGDWERPCRLADEFAADPPPPESRDETARIFFEEMFRPVAIGTPSSRRGLFTGYYMPVIDGALAPGAEFTEPIYRLPEDLVSVDLGRFREDFAGIRLAGRVRDGRLEPYPDRAEIAAGALSGRGLELLWLRDPVDVFFLHIQGSGRVRLPGGRVVAVGYAGTNGHPYRSIGGVLLERGLLRREELALDTVKAWLRANPETARAVMAENASFIFFRPLPTDDAIGAQGVPLTPLRSLAVDPRFVPLGAPVWLEVDMPGPGAAGSGGGRLHRLMVAQDTGSAIKGVVRGDVFWGAGEEAGRQAGRMKDEGRYYLLLPERAAARLGARERAALAAGGE